MDTGEILTCEKILRLLPGKRLVCQALFQSKTVIAKIFVDPAHAARHAKREADGLTALHDAGVASPKMIGQATLSNGATVLITQYLENSVSLSVLLKATVESEAQKIILEKLFRLIAQFHKAGLAQNDLHLDNFLLKEDELYAIDGADLKKTSAPLPLAVALENLECFFAQFDSDSFSMLLEAFSAYTQSNPDLSISGKSLLAGAKKKKQQIWNMLAKKIFRDCTDIIAQRTFRRSMLCKRDYYKGPFLEVLENPDLAIEKATLLKDGNSSTVALVEIAGQKYVIKRYNIKNSVKLLRRQFPPSRVQRNWLYAHLLCFYNIPTSKPIAMIEKRFGPLRFTGYLITEYIDAPDIRCSLELAKDNLEVQQKILTRFVKILKKLAVLNISHGDFKATNFFDTEPATSVIDLDAMTCHRYSVFFQKARRKDRARFLQNFQSDPILYDLAKSILNSS